MNININMYEKAYQIAARWEAKYDELNTKWNKLVDRINAKGGEDFLNDGSINHVKPLSLFELRELRILCHPDKHFNNSRATRMTQQLNSMIRKLENT